MDARFTAMHRGGSGPPLLCLHGFMETWRSWELVLPALERRHDVLAPTLPGHAGGPPLDEPTEEAALDALERLLDDAGVATCHVAGNSLGGWLALKLAVRGRARSVVALAPAGGWAGDDAPRQLLAGQAELHEQVAASARFADQIAATPEGRRRATALLTERSEHLPADLVAHLIRGIAGCDAAGALIDNALRAGWDLDPAAMTCPVRVVWGKADRLLPWPDAAARFRQAWLPHADWVVLDGVGHAPQLDVPLEAAQLILGWTAP